MVPDPRAEEARAEARPALETLRRCRPTHWSGGCEVLEDAMSDSSDRRRFTTMLIVSLPLRFGNGVGDNEAQTLRHAVHSR